MKKYLLPFTALFLSIGLVGCDTNNPVKEDKQHAQEETKNSEEQRQSQKRLKQPEENDSSNQSAPKIEGPELERFKEEQIRKVQAADPKETEEAFDRAAASRRERFERQEIEKMDCDTARSALSHLEKMDNNPIAKKQAVDFQDKVARCNKSGN
ncbi:hypothetical protein OCF57_03945 [Bacillus cereus]|uniref:hypothetical protein n=1 Tax=Bacillus thuringiensis TaxID=1428 RepID=UPI001E36E8BF|nr:hypothetical protein [Bacillus thuringiensis]MCC2539213.1 hypothetical protein [Bacillus thuringiensis]MCU4778011.1 hypothetical protein [Bacillus cereus]